MILLLTLLLLEVGLAIAYPSGFPAAGRAGLLVLLFLLPLYAAVEDLWRRGGWLNRLAYLLGSAWFFSRWPGWSGQIEEVYLAAGPAGAGIALTALYMVIVPLGLLLAPLLLWGTGWIARWRDG